jgi:predicted transcriptional regulator
MACVNPDGTITPTAKSLLQTLEKPLSPEEIGAKIGVPLFRVRSSLRELESAGLVSEAEGRFRTTDEGRKLV